MFVELDDHSIDDSVLLIFLLRFSPWILLQGFDREGDLVILDLDDFDLHLLANLKHCFRIIHETPIDLRDMYQTLESFFNLDEDAEVDKTRHFADELIAQSVVSHD